MSNVTFIFLLAHIWIKGVCKAVGPNELWVGRFYKEPSTIRRAPFIGQYTHTF